MKKILLSLSTIAAVAALAVVGTTAYFTDEEKSTGNTFTAGTIDIAVDGQNPWSKSEPFKLEDMKPSQVDYTNFTITNVGTNPANVWKKVSGVVTTENETNEPELAYYAAQNPPINPTVGKNDIDTVITYDLSVVVKDKTGKVIWNQTLYNMNKTIAEINVMGERGTFLGMIPAEGSMDVTESYHMKPETGNWAQSDKMTFDITVTAEQLTGTVVLEDKDQVAPWRVLADNDLKATFTYGVKDSKLNFTLTGESPITNGQVALVAGYNAGTDPDTLIGYGNTDASGNITMSTNSIDLNKNLINAKLWLIPAGDWDNANHKVINWNMSKYLWETGLIDYYDTDL